MRIPKTGKLLLGGIIVILLSVLIATQTGGFCHDKTPVADDNEDKFRAGLELFSQGDFEIAHGKFNAAWMLAMMFENDSVKAMKAQKYMGDCTFWIGAMDTCIYHYNEAVDLARVMNRSYDEYEIYLQLRQAYIATPEGLFGLQRAFKKAGVQTMVMSLWSVNDEAAKDFMIKFYEELTDSRNKWDKRKASERLLIEPKHILEIIHAINRIPIIGQRS